MNTVGALLGTAWRASPPLLAGLLLVVLFQVLQPFVQAVLVGAVVDSLIGSLAGGGQPGAGLWPLVVFLLLLLVLTVVVGPVLQAVVAALSWRLEARVGRDLLGFVSRIGDVGILDDPQVSGDLGMIRGDNVTLRVSSAVGMFTGLVPMRVGALVMAGLLFSFAWWAPLVLVPGLLLTRLWLMRDGKAFMDSMRAAAGPRQRAAYFRDVMLDRLAAKDVRVFGLSEWMLQQFVTHWNEGLDAVFRGLGRTRWLFVSATVVLGACYGVIAYLIGAVVLTGAASPGSVAVYLGAAIGMMSLVIMPDMEFRFRQAALVFPALESVRLYAGKLDEPVAGVPAAGATEGALTASGVGYRYPNAEAAALHDVSVTFEPGEVLALVGANGSGKSTFVQVLAGLRTRTSGSLHLDGHEFADIDRQVWRSNFSVVFQDFIKWELSLRENLLLSAAVPFADDQLLAALQRVGLAGFLSSLPAGLDTMLSRQFEGGAEPSGGQWQRILLARALIAIEGGARFLILDEPTAHLDLQAELEFYEEFLSHTSGVTRLIITHRLPAVAHADRVAFMRAGTISELGPHAELMRQGGDYRRFYEIQSRHFSDGSDTGTVDDAVA